MKKKMVDLITGMLILSFLAGCAGKPVVSSPGPAPAESAAGETEQTVKTGLHVRTSLLGSAPATQQEPGLIQTNVDFVAVTVGEDGTIDDCVIDSVQVKIGFDSTGKLTTEPDMVFPSKNELGREYGMYKASSIGKEWSEQVQTLADYVKGKTVEQVKGISVQEDGTGAGGDLSASVTIAIGNYLDDIVAAAGNAAHLGAKKGDKLTLQVQAGAEGSRSAEGDQEGVAQSEVTVAAVTLDEGVITGCALDELQVKVSFDRVGDITTDISKSWPTKAELGESYGMKEQSSIGREWDEQVATFCNYVTGKTVSQVLSLAVDEEGHPEGADLAAGVTISIGAFQTLIAKAEGKG